MIIRSNQMNNAFSFLRREGNSKPFIEQLLLCCKPALFSSFPETQIIVISSDPPVISRLINCAIIHTARREGEKKSLDLSLLSSFAGIISFVSFPLPTSEKAQTAKSSVFIAPVFFLLLLSLHFSQKKLENLRDREQGGDRYKL